MIDDNKMLGYICQDAEMGRDAIVHVAKLTEDETFRRILDGQQQGFQESYNAADGLLREQGGKAQGINPMAKAMTYVSSSVKTLTDNSPSHIADLVIQGNTMGITTMTKYINEYGGKDAKIDAMAKKQVKMEQKNIEELKKYL